MATLLIPIPHTDFDPTEVSVPWKRLTAKGHRIVFATPDGQPASADPVMVTGETLGPLKNFFMADRYARSCYAELREAPEFLQPLSYGEVAKAKAEALYLPGGHAPGMRPYLESPLLQSYVADVFAANRPVAAICHGVLVAARSKVAGGDRSVLFGRKTTALPRWMERTAWSVTRLWKGDYYRTYPTWVEEEITSCLEKPSDFRRGPLSFHRDSARKADGFCVVDGRYLSARWPGDVHTLCERFHELLTQSVKPA